MDGYEENLSMVQCEKPLSDSEIQELMNDEFWGDFISWLDEANESKGAKSWLEEVER